MTAITPQTQGRLESPADCSRQRAGFTLIEIIITIVVAAILAAMLTSYYRTSFEMSADPVTRINSSLGLQQVLENMTADHKQNPSALSTLKSSIGAAGSYNNSYGQYTVVENRFIKFDPISRNAIDVVTGDPNNLLLVTIKNDKGDLLTIVYGTQ